MLVRDYNLTSLIGGTNLKIGDIFIAIIFFVLLLNNYCQNASYKFLKSKLDLAVVVFILFCILSLFWSTDLGYGLARVLKLVRNFCFYIVIRDLFIKDFEGSYKRITVSYIITGIILLIVYMVVILSRGGFSDFLTFYHKGVLGSQDLGGLRNPGTGGGFLISGPQDWFIITLVFVFGSLMLAKSRSQRFIIILIVLIFIAAMVTTLSRTAIIVTGVILVVLFLGSLKLRLRKNISALISILIIVTILGTVFGITGICFKRFVNVTKDGSWTQRMDYYRTAIDAFVYSPIWGIGVGSNFSWQAKYLLEQARIVHNLSLLVLSEVGLLGFAIFIMIIWIWLKYLWVCMHRFDDKPYFKGISLAMFAFTIGYIVQTLTVGEFESFEPWLVMGITSALIYIKRNIKVTEELKAY